MHSLASTSGRAAAVSHTHRQATALQGMAHQGWHAPAPAGASGVLQRSSAHALLPQQQQRPWRSQGRRALQLLRATGLEEADTATTSTPPTPASPPPATPPPESTSSTSSSTSTSSPAKIQRTLMDLDAILGIQPDAPPATSSKGTQTIDALSKLTSDAAPAQSAAGAADAKAGSPPQDKVEEQVQRIVEKARKMANEQGKGAPMEAEQQQLRQEFESLLQNMNSPAALDKETIKKIKDAAFGPQTFFVTETQQLTQADRTGLLVRGNLRDERDKVYEHVRAKVAELFGDKYTVIMVEDEQAMLEAGAGVGGLGGAAGPGTSSGPRQSGAASRAQELNTPRIAFQIVPTAQATPPQPNGWKGVVAVGLLLLFLGSCGQLALAANITKLPRETLEWFANPANFESDQLPPGLENWDPTSYFSTAAPIFGAVISSNLAHEIGHRMAAAWQGVKVGPSYFIPNFQIGSFGAITPITTLLKNRTQLWDVAAAGPLAGLIFSALLLAIGLSQSQTGALPADALVPVPTPLFQGSLLLGAAVPQYLLPKELSPLCHGSNCCQEDDYTSAFQIMMLNSSRAVFGGRTYTTFFMNLQRSFMCDADIDTAGCCNANVSTIWIDVDPDLKVVYTTLNAQRWVSVTQDPYGFRLSVTQEQYLALPPSTLMSVTVAGAVEHLCQLPDIAPVPGLCDVILEGGTTSNPTACCPRGLSRPSSISNWVPPNSFSCVADLSASPFTLAQATVSNVYIGQDGTEYVDYSLNLSQNMQCREGPSSCCGMHLSNLEVRVLADANIKSVSLGGQSYQFTISDWNDTQTQDNAMYRVLSVGGLNLPVEDVPRAGSPLTVTVQLPSAALSVPQLCAPVAESELGNYSPCSYFLYSDDGLCCPSGLTNAVTGPVIPSACNPTQEVPMADTSFGFMYYEYLASADKTHFTFVVTSNGNSSDCGKQYCAGVCGWQLAVQDSLLPSLTYQSDTGDVAARTLVQRGNDAGVIFSYANGADQVEYVITAPGNTPLERLCRAGVHPDQGNWPCAATIRSSGVYAMVFFSQDSLVIKTYPDVCQVSEPLAASCLRPVAARYNSPEGSSSTVFEFTLARDDPAATGCQAASSDLAFEVILFPAAVGELVESQALVPRDQVAFNMTSGVEWSATPEAANAAQNYSFRLEGVQSVRNVCIQNLPNQTRDSCMVQLQDANHCFNGFVQPVWDPALIWSPNYGEPSPKPKASVVVPAVVVPVVVLAAAALLAAFIIRRRRRQSAAVGVDDSTEPLTGGAHPPEGVESSAPSAASGGADMPSRAPSDVQLRVPSGSARRNL